MNQPQPITFTALYRGTRVKSRPGALGHCVVTRISDGRNLPLRLDLRNHSPTGFEWGYFGSGCAQLALAILCDYLKNDARAAELYQLFKADFVAKLDRETDWLLSKERIDEFLEAAGG